MGLSVERSRWPGFRKQVRVALFCLWNFCVFTSNYCVCSFAEDHSLSQQAEHIQSRMQISVGIS